LLFQTISQWLSILDVEHLIEGYIDTLSRNIIERYQVIPKASTADSTVEFAKGFDTGFDGAVMVCKRRILAKKHRGDLRSPASGT